MEIVNCFLATSFFNKAEKSFLYKRARMVLTFKLGKSWGLMWSRGGWLAILKIYSTCEKALCSGLFSESASCKILCGIQIDKSLLIVFYLFSKIRKKIKLEKRDLSDEILLVVFHSLAIFSTERFL